MTGVAIENAVRWTPHPVLRIPTRTQAAAMLAGLLANGGGRVAYGEGGKTYTWTASTGQTTLRLDTVPGQVFIAGGALVFTVGPSVYRVGVE